MFRKDNNKLDMLKINQSIDLLHKILKISYIFIVVIGIYAFTLVMKEWGIITFLKTILKVLAPFFIGLVIAWLFNPIVTYLNKNKINRVLGSVIVYAVFLGILVLMISSIIPLITEQVNDLVGTIPEIINSVSEWISDGFEKFNNNSNLNLSSFKDQIFLTISNFGKNITTALPTTMMTIITSFFSGVGTFVLGLMIGFYMLFNFDNVNKTLISFLPKNIRKDARKLLGEINETLLSFVHGTLLVSTIIFVTNYIGFLIIGVKAPLLFALFCGLTNIIPYAGPYIGGIPVALVALSQNTTMGIFVIIYIIGVQMLEGNFLQPVVMSKTMKLSPVTILISLLIFGYFFGIIGMMFATPVVAVIKTIFTFFNEKYDLTKYQTE
ncbi:MAG: AI-2E family transporter [Bacilli bacterium]|nr:AI-2E family transporter [Bacilli bacterium]